MTHIRNYKNCSAAINRMLYKRGYPKKRYASIDNDYNIGINLNQMNSSYANLKDEYIKKNRILILKWLDEIIKPIIKKYNIKSNHVLIEFNYWHDNKCAYGLDGKLYNTKYKP